MKSNTNNTTPGSGGRARKQSSLLSYFGFGASAGSQRGKNDGARKSTTKQLRTPSSVAKSVPTLSSVILHDTESESVKNGELKRTQMDSSAIDSSPLLAKNIYGATKQSSMSSCSSASHGTTRSPLRHVGNSKRVLPPSDVDQDDNSSDVKMPPRKSHRPVEKCRTTSAEKIDSLKSSLSTSSSSSSSIKPVPGSKDLPLSLSSSSSFPSPKTFPNGQLIDLTVDSEISDQSSTLHPPLDQQHLVKENKMNDAKETKGEGKLENPYLVDVNETLSVPGMSPLNQILLGASTSPLPRSIPEPETAPPFQSRLSDIACPQSAEKPHVPSFLREGDRCAVLIKPRKDQRDKFGRLKISTWEPGIVIGVAKVSKKALEETNRVKILLDSGKTRTEVWKPHGESLVQRLVQNQPGIEHLEMKPSVSRTSAPKDLQVGDAVLAWFQRLQGDTESIPNRFPGRVASIDGDTCSVAYDDGDWEDGIPFIMTEPSAALIRFSLGWEEPQWMTGMQVTCRSRKSSNTQAVVASAIPKGPVWLKFDDHKPPEKFSYKAVVQSIMKAARAKAVKIAIWPEETEFETSIQTEPSPCSIKKSSSATEGSFDDLHTTLTSAATFEDIKDTSYRPSPSPGSQQTNAEEDCSDYSPTPRKLPPSRKRKAPAHKDNNDKQKASSRRQPSKQSRQEDSNADADDSDYSSTSTKRPARRKRNAASILTKNESDNRKVSFPQPTVTVAPPQNLNADEGCSDSSPPLKKRPTRRKRKALAAALPNRNHTDEPNISTEDSNNSNNANSVDMGSMPTVISGSADMAPAKVARNGGRSARTRNSRSVEIKPTNGLATKSRDAELEVSFNKPPPEQPSIRIVTDDAEEPAEKLPERKTQKDPKKITQPKRKGRVRGNTAEAQNCVSESDTEDAFSWTEKLPLPKAPSTPRAKHWTKPRISSLFDSSIARAWNSTDSQLAANVFSHAQSHHRLEANGKLQEAIDEVILIGPVCDRMPFPDCQRIDLANEVARDVNISWVPFWDQIASNMYTADGDDRRMTEFAVQRVATSAHAKAIAAERFLSLAQADFPRVPCSWLQQINANPKGPRESFQSAINTYLALWMSYGHYYISTDWTIENVTNNSRVFVQRNVRKLLQSLGKILSYAGQAYAMESGLDYIAISHFLRERIESRLHSYSLPDDLCGSLSQTTIIDRIKMRMVLDLDAKVLPKVRPALAAQLGLADRYNAIFS